MNPNPKSTKDAPPEAASPERIELPDNALPALFAALTHKGLERMVQAQKTALDLFAVQNAEMLDTVKRAFRLPPSMPGMFMFDLAGQAVERYVETQKSIMDIIVEQSATFVAHQRKRRRDGRIRNHRGHR
jgi:hypothetical protein